MTNTFEKTQAVRTKLEEKYTHVTFVKTETNIHGEFTVWYVGEDMETIKIDMEWTIEELFPRMEMSKIMKESRGRVKAEKSWYFFNLMLKGLIASDAKLYKKFTEKQLRAMYQ